MIIDSVESQGWLKNSAKMAALVFVVFLLAACDKPAMFDGSSIKLEALSEQNERNIVAMKEDMRTTNDRFMALESLYVDVAQTLRTQSDSLDTIEEGLSKFKINPASASAVEDIKDQLSGLQRNLQVLQSRIVKVEMGVGKAASDAAAEPVVTPLGDGSEFAAHVASYRDIAQVTPGWASLQAKFPGMFNGLRAVNDTIETAGLGKFIRLLVGPFKGESDAQRLCDQIKENGDFCQVASFKGDLVN